mmetsp:Transcript_15036/g.37500  ORF Transcript_15036/g.37500 Transcript_15036/m.37500 type:complete len:85 (+) Transcript_15036:83-337(+)
MCQAKNQTRNSEEESESWRSTSYQMRCMHAAAARAAARVAINACIMASLRHTSHSSSLYQHAIQSNADAKQPSSCGQAIRMPST